MDGVIFASEDDFDRSAKATRYVESLRRSQGQAIPDPKPLGLEVVVVKVTASSSTEGQYWAGVVTHKDFEAGVDEWYEEDEDSSDNPKVLVVTLAGESPGQDRRYIGVLIGEHDGYPVVLVAILRTKVKGVLDATLTQGASTTMSVWEYSGSEGDTGENLTVYDWLLDTGQTVASGARVTAFYDANSGRWYVDGARCSS